MRIPVTVLWALLSMTPAMGEVSVGIGISVPGVSIGDERARERIK
jgi:hypothetical protein